MSLFTEKCIHSIVFAILHICIVNQSSLYFFIENESLSMISKYFLSEIEEYM